MPLFLLQTISQVKPCTPETIISLFISLPGYKPMQFFIFTPKESPWDFNVHLSVVFKCIPIVTAPSPPQPHHPPTLEEYKATKNILWKICGILRATYQVSIKFRNWFISKKLWFKTDLLPMLRRCNKTGDKRIPKHLAKAVLYAGYELMSQWYNYLCFLFRPPENITKTFEFLISSASQKVNE